jgi:hypothetical protein
MISQNSNNKPSGSTAVQCDAGIPIMGRTGDTGVYQILKVNADGSLPIPSVTIPTFPDLETPNTTPLAPAGAKAVNLILSYGSFTVNVATAGNYTIRPFFMAQLTVLGAVNMYLIKQGSVLDAYTTSRAVGVDSYNPAITDYVNGLAAAFHNIANQFIGVNIAKTFITSNIENFNVYLETGDYKLLVVVHTALTTGSTTVYDGFEIFTPTN